MTMPVDHEYVGLHQLCAARGWSFELVRLDSGKLELQVVKQTKLSKARICEELVAGREGEAAAELLNRLVRTAA